MATQRHRKAARALNARETNTRPARKGSPLTLDISEQTKEERLINAERPPDRRIAAVLARIEENALQHGNIQHLAGQVNLSESRLRHLFRSEVGVPICSYIRKRRITIAARLLRETYARVSEVADRTQFRSLSQFDKWFRAYVGTSPSRFRNTADWNQPARYSAITEGPDSARKQ